MRSPIRFLLNTLFPPHCVSCKTEGDFLCKKCVQELQKKKIRPLQGQCPLPREFKHLDGVIYALDYAKNPAIKAAIEQFKYKFNEELASYFGDLVSEKLRELKMIRHQRLHLVPVPLHPKRFNYRGFNQAQLIAEAVLRSLSPGAQVQIDSLLQRVKNTEQQAKLNRKERNQNLQNAFSMNKKIVQDISPQENLYFLVDDVCTTGSTLEQAAKVLKANGFGKIYGLVVARALA